jgi:hypothetical protein
MAQWPEIAKIKNEVLSSSQGEIALLPHYSVHPASQGIFLHARDLAVRRDLDAISDDKSIVGAMTGLLRDQGIGRGNELLGNPVHTRWACPKELAIERYRLVHAAPLRWQKVGWREVTRFATVNIAPA